MRPKKGCKIIISCFLILGFFYFSIEIKKLEDHDIDISKLKDYDLILSKGQSFQSKLLNIFNLSFDDYTHIGIVRKQRNKIYILHSTPDGTKNNSIRYDELKLFLNLSDVNDIKVLRFKRISDTDLYKLHRGFEVYRQNEASFDYQFNNLEHEKLYCSELVYLIYSRVNLLNAHNFDLNKPIHPKYFLNLKNLSSLNYR